VLSYYKPRKRDWGRSVRACEHPPIQPSTSTTEHCPSSLVVSMSVVTHGAVAHTIGKFRAEVKHERELHWCPPNKSNRMREGYEASAACGDYIGGLTLGTGSTE
jgi:hypothetical protein